MKKIVRTIIVVVLIAVSFFIGFRCGVVEGDYNRPPGVTTTRLMRESWDVTVKAIEQDEAIGEVIREEIVLGNEQGVLNFKNAFNNFEPMVFCHPFIILKRKDNMGYKVFMNTNVNDPGFDNMIAPSIDFYEYTDNIGIQHNNYLLSMPPRKMGATYVSDLSILVKTDKENNRTTTLVSVSNAKQNESFWYRDLNADGIFESIVHVDSLIFTEIQKMTHYSLIEFAEQYGDR